MAHDITKDVIGCKEFEGQKVNLSGVPLKFFGSIADPEDMIHKAYVDTEILTAWLKTLGQTGLTGDKTGSFNLTTTKDITSNTGIFNTVKLISPTENTADITFVSGGYAAFDRTTSISLEAGGGVDQELNMTTGAMSCFVKFKTANLGVGNEGIVTFGTDGNGDNIIAIRKIGSSINFTYKGDGTTTNVVTTSAGMDEWTHIMGVWDADFLYYYINGSIIGSPVSRGGDANQGAMDLALLGEFPNTRGNFLDGDLDEVMIFTNAPDATEIALIAAADRNTGTYEGVSKASLIEHYRFDDGTADTDISGGIDGNLPLTGVAIINEDGVNFDGANITNFKDINFSIGGSGLTFGEIYVQDNTTETTITTSGKVNKVQIEIFDTNGESNNTTPDHTNNHITINKTGRYKVSVDNFSISSTGGDSDTLGFSLYTNNGTTEFPNVHTHRKFSGGAGDRGANPMGGICFFNGGDTVEVWGWNEDDNDNFTVDDINLNLMQISG